jgi:hypothetical protein
MTDPDYEREYHESTLRDAPLVLDAIDKMLDGAPGAYLSVDHLGWLRSVVLDRVEAAQVAIGLDLDQAPESVLQTIRLGMNSGAMALLEEELTPRLPVPEERQIDGVLWLLRVPCPECGEFTVEQTGPDDGPDYGLDHRAVTVHPDRDSYDSPIGTRGGYTQIDLWCPAGHSFALIIANHKGDEYFGAITAQ